MKQYNYQRKISNYSDLESQILKESNMSKYLNSEIKQSKDNIEEIKKQFTSLIRNRYVFTHDHNIESLSNTLYLMALYNVECKDTEKFVRGFLNDKGMENLSIFNLGDILYYNNKIKKKDCDEILGKLEKKLTFVLESTHVEQNGNCTESYQEKVKTFRSFEERLILMNTHSNDWISFFQMKVTRNLIKLMGNFFRGEQLVISNYEEVSYYQELKRIKSALKSSKSEKAKNLLSLLEQLIIIN